VGAPEPVTANNFACIAAKVDMSRKNRVLQEDDSDEDLGGSFVGTAKDAAANRKNKNKSADEKQVPVCSSFVVVLGAVI